MEINSLKESILEKVKAKAEEYEKNGVADKEFEKQLEQNKIFMWLPASVFDQQRMISMAMAIYNEPSEIFEENLSNREKFARWVLKHTKRNGKVLDPNDCSIADIESYSLLYWVELLSPLFLWGEERTKKLISL